MLQYIYASICLQILKLCYLIFEFSFATSEFRIYSARDLFKHSLGEETVIWKTSGHSKKHQNVSWHNYTLVLQMYTQFN